MLYLDGGIIETRNLHSVTRDKAEDKLLLHYREGKYFNTIEIIYEHTDECNKDFGKLVKHFKSVCP